MAAAGWVGWTTHGQPRKAGWALPRDQTGRQSQSGFLKAERWCKGGWGVWRAILEEGEEGLVVQQIALLNQTPILLSGPAWGDAFTFQVWSSVLRPQPLPCKRTKRCHLNYTHARKWTNLYVPVINQHPKRQKFCSQIREGLRTTFEPSLALYLNIIAHSIWKTYLCSGGLSDCCWRTPAAHAPPPPPSLVLSSPRPWLGCSALLQTFPSSWSSLQVVRQAFLAIPSVLQLSQPG